MKSIFKQLSKITFVIVFFTAFTTFATGIPDPEILAKEYINDLCTLSEERFTQKYMLTQSDVVYLISESNKTFLQFNDLEQYNRTVTDTLKMRSNVQEVVVNSYQKFKEWQQNNNIDPSKITYKFCQYDLRKRIESPFLQVDYFKIYISHDTSNFIISMQGFMFLQTKWVIGDLQKIYPANAKYRIANDYYSENYTVDTVVVNSDYITESEYYETSSGEVYELPPATKKQLKAQKKIDAYNRKIDALIKKYESPTRF